MTTSWQRVLALSGVVFAVLFVVGWFASGGDAGLRGGGPGVLALVIWSIATSIAMDREETSAAGGPVVSR